ncbi:hypothetical protein ACFLQV_01065 [Calditrichota bacterium]
MSFIALLLIFVCPFVRSDRDSWANLPCFEVLEAGSQSGLTLASSLVKDTEMVQPIRTLSAAHG